LKKETHNSMDTMNTILIAMHRKYCVRSSSH
jgi:hypothetical protein